MTECSPDFCGRPRMASTDPVTSGAAVLADATDEEVDVFLGAVMGPSGAGRSGRPEY